jgi:hypothetical protein
MGTKITTLKTPSLCGAEHAGWYLTLIGPFLDLFADVWPVIVEKVYTRC